MTPETSAPQASLTKALGAFRERERKSIDPGKDLLVLAAPSSTTAKPGR